MSMLPIVHGMVTDIKRPLSFLDRELGIALLNDSLLFPHGTLAGPVTPGYIRHWRHVPGHKSGTSNVKLDKNGFMVNLDVQHFEPDEVVVKTKDNFVIVEGNHDERTDEHGFVTRRFKRRYMLPKDVEAEGITSTMSSDGVLTIQAPKKKALTDENARIIPIVRTEAPVIKGSEPASIANGGAQCMET